MYVVCAHVGGPFGALGALFRVGVGLEIFGAVPRGAQQGFSQIGPRNWPTWATCSGLGGHIISILMGTVGPSMALGF